MLRFIGRFLGILCVGCCLGCNATDNGMAHVTGVLLDQEGSPVPDASLTFFPAEGRSSVGDTNESGEFTLYYDIGKPGAAIGMHSVRIMTGAHTLPPPPGSPPEAFKNFKSPRNYKLEDQIEVKEGSNELSIQLPKNGSRASRSR